MEQEGGKSMPEEKKNYHKKHSAKEKASFGKGRTVGFVEGVKFAEAGGKLKPGKGKPNKGK